MINLKQNKESIHNYMHKANKIITKPTRAQRRANQRLKLKSC